MYRDVIMEELNVKAIEFTQDTDEYMNYNLKPQLKTLGPKYGKALPKIREWLVNANGKEVVSAFKAGKTVEFAVDGVDIVLAQDDVLIEPTYAEGYAVEQENGIAVVLDTGLTEELINEGIIREIISKVQTMRKEAGFEVTDRIRVQYVGDELDKVIEAGMEELKKTLLAENITKGENGSYNKELDINGHKMKVAIEKIN